MVAQTLVEYGVLNSIAAGFSTAYSRVETFFGSGNSKYLIFAALVIILALLMKRRRAR